MVKFVINEVSWGDGVVIYRRERFLLIGFGIEVWVRDGYKYKF